jgi:hypothetical protein
MFWVIQANLYSEQAFESLLAQLEHQEVRYAVVQVVPFSHDLVPDLDVLDSVFVCGSLSMQHVAERKGWKPGYFKAPNYQQAMTFFGDEVLNSDARFMTLSDVLRTDDLPSLMFARPVEDSKTFAGQLFTRKELMSWAYKVVKLKEESSYSSITGDDMILLAEPKEIWAEYRFFVVNKVVVTGSLYKRGDRVHYSPDVDDEVRLYAQGQAAKLPAWHGTVALDVAVTPYGLKVLELNSINSAGFYACDMGKFVNAINNLEAS